MNQIQPFTPKRLSLQEISFYSDEILKIEKQSLHYNTVEVVTEINLNKYKIDHIRNIIYEIIGLGIGNHLQTDYQKSAAFTLKLTGSTPEKRKKLFQEIEYDIKNDHIIDCFCSNISEDHASTSKTYNLYHDTRNLSNQQECKINSRL